MKVTMINGNVVEANVFDYVAQIYEGGKWKTVAVSPDYNEAEKKRIEYAIKGCYARTEQLYQLIIYRRYDNDDKRRGNQSSDGFEGL